MGVLVCDQAGIEAAVTIGRRGVEQVQLESGRRSVDGCEEGRVVGREPVLSFGAQGVATEATVSVVVRLKVPRRFVEAVGGGDVVHHVGPVEEIDDRSVLAVDRLLAEVERGVEDQRGPAVWASRIRLLVGVGVGVCRDVVALCGRELGAGDTVRVMPTERRFEEISGVDDRAAITEARSLHRLGVHVVGVPRRQILPIDLGARLGVDADLPHGRAVSFFDHDLPCERQASIDIDEDEMRRDFRGGDSSVVENLDAFRTGRDASALEVRIWAEPERRRSSSGCLRRVLARSQRRPSTLRRARDRFTDNSSNLAGCVDHHVKGAADDVDARHLLLEVDDARAAHRVDHVGHLEPGEVARIEAERRPVRPDVRKGRLGR